MSKAQKIIKVEGKPDMHIPAEQINPNKYAGSYIIAMVCKLRRGDLKVVDRTKMMVTKLYKHAGYVYCCPQVGEQPPEGLSWILQGKEYQREVFRSRI